MASLNRSTLIGRLGADPEVRYMASGEAVANIRLATTEQWKDSHTGEKTERTEWHRVVFYRKLAEVVGQHLKKGYEIYVEGPIRTRKWKDKEGNDRYITEIEGTMMQILNSPRQSGNDQSKPSSASRSAPPASDAPSFTDDDYPG